MTTTITKIHIRYAFDCPKCDEDIEISEGNFDDTDLHGNQYCEMDCPNCHEELAIIKPK